ncbi:DNA methyltransferase [Advenella sp. FME57]|uniref:class I SAM-dependent DNA methyltransferase n=1 Tax=Advenella sp. FME57 TaxID=2742604 RepID=UPI00186854B2|nr:DNA methyltransferase [Advenella sp. FME57]
MAISQARIIESLERACSNLHPDEFIFSFLDAYGFPKSTITRLRNGGDSRNVAQGDDIGLKKKLYFRVVPAGQDVSAEADSLKESDLISRNDIRFIIVTDFETLVAFDMKAEERLETTLDELDKKYSFFLPLAGYEKAVMHSDHPADLKASEKMGQLFDLIRERNELTKPKDIHALNVFLTRLLFCFYAEDTGIFDDRQMTSTLQACTKEDGSDVDQFFTDLFAVLNLSDDTPERKRMPSHFQAFKYVNGGLFRDDEPIPEFGRKARRILLDCGLLNWSEINPDIFGSMFQAVIDEGQRGNLGQHYTSVSNIMKVIQPLFLDPLHTELEKSRNNEKKLKALLLRLQSLRIFDPACGSGNFLIIAYKELRKLEMQVINALNATGAQSVMYYSGIKLTQFYGIEIDDFAHEVASLSLWLAEHQMNMAFNAQFGYAEAALPLRDGGNVVCGNSLRLDWEEVCPPTDEHGNLYEIYICGNPPFLGTTERSAEQSADMKHVFSSFESIGYLDIVAAWFWKGANYIKDRRARCAFVSTSSICQGDQTSLLWPFIFNLGISIGFCYKTFPWSNNAKGKAAVHVVIIGLKNASDTETRPQIFEVAKDQAIISEVEMIGPYLVPGSRLTITPRTRPICPVNGMIRGSQPTDGGNLYLTNHERDLFIEKYPQHSHWVRRVVGASEYINGRERWCLWLADIPLAEAIRVPEVAERCEKVRALRVKAGHAAALKGAESPHTFLQVAQPKEGHYILVPAFTSERRSYVPIGFMDVDVITNNKNYIVPNGTLYEFGILTSEMHMDWMRTVCGRLESRYGYSTTIVYNTFPWPDASETKRKHIESLAEEVLLIREDYPDQSLGDLYDPNKMPIPLLEAHKALDRAVEALYRDRPFRDVSERLEHLFARYEKLIAEEKAKAPAKKAKGRK